jgi:hypothetical protein
MVLCILIYMTTLPVINTKGESKFVLCVSNIRCMGGVEIYLHEFLTSAVAASSFGYFTAGEGTFGTYGIGDWVEPRAVLDAAVKRKTLIPAGN